MSMVPPWLASSEAVGSSACCHASQHKEYDIKVREATLWLFTRPVTDTLPDDVKYQHWALVFHFEDGNDFRTAEGFGDHEGKLFGSYTKTHPGRKGRYFKVGILMTSPANVRQLTIDNPWNGKAYQATWQNCQTWVKELAKMLGKEIYNKITNYSTLMEGNPVVAVLGKTLGSLSTVSNSASDCSNSIVNS